VIDNWLYYSAIPSSSSVEAIYAFNVQTLENRRLLDFSGASISALSVSERGEIAVAVERGPNGVSDLYIYNPEGEQFTRLSVPSWSFVRWGSYPTYLHAE
jgi:hypothetical protein